MGQLGLSMIVRDWYNFVKSLTRVMKFYEATGHGGRKRLLPLEFMPMDSPIV